MGPLRPHPGVLANQPDVQARLRALEESPLAAYLPILDADPDLPGEGQLWIVRSGGSVYLRTSVDGVIKSVTLT